MVYVCVGSLRSGEMENGERGRENARAKCYVIEK